MPFPEIPNWVVSAAFGAGGVISALKYVQVTLNEQKKINEDQEVRIVGLEKCSQLKVCLKDCMDNRRACHLTDSVAKNLYERDREALQNELQGIKDQVYKNSEIMQVIRRNQDLVLRKLDIDSVE